MIIYFTELKKEYLSAVLNLRKKSYPEELVLGEEHFLEVCRKDYSKNDSICCFAKGNLVGYIIAYKEKAMDKNIYISDLNCPNPRYLRRLLMKFFAGHDGTVYEAVLRENVYRLLYNQQRRYNGMIQIVEQESVPCFYDDFESSYHVRFMVNIEKYLDSNWKNKFQSHFDNISGYEYDDIMSYVFKPIIELTKKGINFYEEKNMCFVIQCMRENLLDYYQMFGESIPYRMTVSMLARSRKEGKKAFEGTIQKLKKMGYEEESGKNRYEYAIWSKKLYVSREGIIRNTRYPDKLSGVRWLWRTQLKYECKWRDLYWPIYYNKYDVKQDMIKVPYLTKRNYLYYLGRGSYELHLLENLQINDQEKKSLHRIIVDVYFLLGSKEAQECIDCIMKKYKGKTNFFHDWALRVNDLLSAKDIMTKGAMKTVLCSSYNQALKVCRNVDSIKQAVLDDTMVQRLFDINEIRKKVSKYIRNHKDCGPYVLELSHYVTMHFSDKIGLKGSEREAVPEFMARIQKYCPTMTVYTLYRMFGKKCFCGFLSGTYKGLFSPKTFNPSFESLCNFVKETLRRKTVQAKHVYGKLLKGNLLTEVMNNTVTLQQYGEIMRILEQHNVSGMDGALRNLGYFKAVIEPKGSPEYLIAGDATVCCMSLGSDKAKIYAVEKGFGIVNIYFHERIIANAVIWINAPYRCLVLDNIEVHPNYMKYSRQIKLCFHSVAKYLMEEHKLRSVVQGVNYNDIILYQENTEEKRFEKMEPLGVKTASFYSDARFYKVVMQKIHEARHPSEEIAAA